MPILNWHYQNPKITPAQLLRVHGPKIQVEVSPHILVQQLQSTTGVALPPPVSGDALIDTGAIRTCIDNEVAKTLGLHSIGTCQMASAQGVGLASTYAFTLMVKGGLRLNAINGIGADIRRQNLVALIGMDILCQCVLIVNGPDGRFSLCTV